MKVSELISYLQTFSSDLDVKIIIVNREWMEDNLENDCNGETQPIVNCFTDMETYNIVHRPSNRVRHFGDIINVKEAIYFKPTEWKYK